MSEHVSFGPIGDDSPWKAEVNGEPTDVRQLSLDSRWGKLEFGQGSDGRKGWLWTETGGGGSVTTPWSVSPEGQLLIGILTENRQNMGGAVDCVIGGFKKPDETHQVTANREQEAEAGIIESAGELPGVPVNSNRLYFQADHRKGEGVHSFQVPVPFTDLVQLVDQPGCFVHKSWQPKPGTPLIFKPIEQAAQDCPDVLAYPGMLRVLLKLLEENRGSLRECLTQPSA